MKRIFIAIFSILLLLCSCSSEEKDTVVLSLGDYMDKDYYSEGFFRILLIMLSIIMKTLILKTTLIFNEFQFAVKMIYWLTLMILKNGLRQ